MKRCVSCIVRIDFVFFFFGLTHTIDPYQVILNNSSSVLKSWSLTDFLLTENTLFSKVLVSGLEHLVHQSATIIIIIIIIIITIIIKFLGILMEHGSC